MATTLHIVDYFIFVVVIVISFGIGIYHAFTGGRQNTTKEYLTGNRRMKTIPVTLSLLVSFISGIVVLGTPAEMYTRGTQLYMRTLGYCASCVLSSVFIVPLFYLLKVTSSFEYLEQRYQSKTTKLLGTVSMLVGSVFYMGLLIYTPATAISTTTQLPLYACILAVAITTTMYTALGGLRGVVWTDAFQAVVMVTGLLFIVVKGVMLVGGFEKMWQMNEKGGRLKFFDFNPDPTQRLSFWSTVIGGAFSTLTTFGVGQVSVQRYCSLPSLKKAQLSILLNIPCLILMNTLTSLVGLVIYAYYSSIQCDPIKSKMIKSSNQLVPFFILNQLNYPGIPGAFLAVLFSGALSSMSSTLNSCAAVTWQDLLRDHVDKIKNKMATNTNKMATNSNMVRKTKIVAKPKVANGSAVANGSESVTGNGLITGSSMMMERGDGKLSEKTKTTILKILVVLYGMAALGMAFMAQMLGQHVLQASLSFSGATMGPALGMFLLGGIFPFANSKGAISGCIISSIFSFWLSIGAFVHKSHPQTLPTSIAGCLANLSSTILSDSLMKDAVLSDRTAGLERFHEISFLWYSAMGCVMTVVIGVVVSLACKTKGQDRQEDRLLMHLNASVFGCHGDETHVGEQGEEEHSTRF